MRVGKLWHFNFGAAVKLVFSDHQCIRFQTIMVLGGLSVIRQKNSPFPINGQIILFLPTPGAPQEEASAPHFLFGATEPGFQSEI